MTTRTRAIVAALALLAVLVSSGIVEAQSNRRRSNFDWIVARDLTVRDDLATVDLTLTPAAEIVVTMNATITPLGSYQPLSSAGTVNTSSITVGPAGNLLTLVNTANTSIVFTDTGTLKLSGNITLGQFDTLTLVSDGVNWVQRSTSNN